MPEEHQYTNALINETSPYLLQHAHNPVNWNPWNDSTLEKAKKENKLILISVGYAACHWCHVMERESFQDSIVADLMNNNFINIKVDREERPDVDQVYMNAVQIMTGSGGWPMNVVALPDGRPVWGGTYFPKDNWQQALTQVSELYKNEPQRLYEYASKLEQGIKGLDLIEVNTEEPNFVQEDHKNALKEWEVSFDHTMGGYKKAPKFMMPNNYHYLLRNAFQNDDTQLLDYVNLTLTKMAYGGVYDHIGGGFARYSTDLKWHVPHFEKMLYDNGQLVSLYSDAYKINQNPLYKDVVYETLEFVERELAHQDGYFYSSLDADSDNAEGHHEEGAFYVWNQKELKKLLGNDYSIFADYYNINNFGKWEKEQYVLIRKDSDEEISKKHNINSAELSKKVREWKTKLLLEREKRSRPNLDDKSLTSWNALMLKGYADAYSAFGEQHFLEMAIKNANFIIKKQAKEDGGLFHSFKNGKSTINGYLEDYSTTVQALLTLYENTLDDKWLISARYLTNYAIDHFFDEQSKMFFFTSNEDAKLVSRSIEYRDNVIAASNSIMAKNLFKLSHHFENKAYLKMAEQMLNNVKAELLQYPSGFSNWMDLMMNFTNPYYEVAVTGANAKQKAFEFNKKYIPNKLISGSITSSNLPLLKNRFEEESTLFFICQNSVCKLPTEDIYKAQTLINKK